MYKGQAEAAEFCVALREERLDDVDVVVCPPYVSLAVTVQLLDADGNVVATTVTRADGSYRFDGLDLGTFTVQTLLPSGWVQTTPSATVELTRGMTATAAKLGVQRKDPLAPALPAIDPNGGLCDPLNS